MQIEPGTRLGPYEVLSPLGAGGMGEVYRARDTRLDRDVAIKVLSSHLTASDEVRQRFEREARAVSSLNHPHICALYDVGHENGVDFLVLEYLEGETLQARLQRGPLPMRETLDIAIQIADALDRAHRQGLVHRDLKPGNIMLTHAGAKLLDFGLARSAELGGGNSDLSQSPTVARSLTAEGAIVGTFQYMAPEQLEGKPADARTDLFALGTVMYEMATGQPAFTGQSQASLIASILKDQPRNVSDLQPMTPPSFERLARRCLEKNPNDRWQTARDLMLELTWVRDSGSQAGVAAPVRARRRSRERLAWVLAAGFGVAAAFFAVRGLTRHAPAPMLGRYNIQVDRGDALGMAQMHLSPDGTQLLYAASDTTGVTRLWVRRLDNWNASPLPGTDGAILPFWAPDSRRVAFFTLSGKLMRTRIPDGTPQVVCNAESGRGGAWSKDDVIVFAAASGGPLFAVPAEGGTPRQVTALDSTRHQSAHRFPCFLPDGKHFLYVALPVHDGVFDLFVGSLDDRSARLVGTAWGAAIYVEPGYLLYGRGQSLIAQRFDAGRLETAGPALTLGEPLGSSGGWSGSPNVTASDTGLLLHSSSGVTGTTIMQCDHQGNEMGPVRLDPGIYFDVAPSPDENRLAVSRAVEASLDSPSDIFVVDLRRGTSTRMTFDNTANNVAPIWSPDGRRIAYTSNRSGVEHIYVHEVGGSGEDRTWDKSNLSFIRPLVWSPDGKNIVYHALSSKTGFDLWRLPMDGEAVPLLMTSFNEKGGALSPDGKWIAYQSDESGSFELYANRFPGMDDKHRISIHGAGQYGDLFTLWWSPDGKQILYEAPDATAIMRVDVDTGPPFHAGTPAVVARLPHRRYGDLLAIGKKSMFEIVDEQGTSALSIVTNWRELLKKQ